MKFGLGSGLILTLLIWIATLFILQSIMPFLNYDDLNKGFIEGSLTMAITFYFMYNFVNFKEEELN